MFYVWQALLIGLAVFAAFRDGLPARLFRRAQPGDLRLTYRRSDVRMGTLLAIAATVIAIVVGIPLSVDLGLSPRAKIGWSLLDLAVLVYMFGFNNWFRGYVHRFGDRIREERR